MKSQSSQARRLRARLWLALLVRALEDYLDTMTRPRLVFFLTGCALWGSGVCQAAHILGAL